MEQERERRVRALVGAVACADATLQKRVWLRLVDSFWLQRNGEADGWRIERKKEGGDGRGEGKGDAIRYDWSCARCGWGGCSMEAGTIYCRKCEWQCEQWCAAAESQTLCSIAEMDQVIQSEPVGKIVGNRMMQRMGEVRQQMKNKIEQLRLDGWKGEVAKVVEKELGEGRVDVRRLVIGVMDGVVGRELDGVLLPKPLLSAAAIKYEKADRKADKGADEKAAEGAVLEEALKTEEAPKVPVDGTGSLAAALARVLASSKVSRSSGANGPAAKQLAAVGSETATKDEIADEAPKAPVDLIAKVLANSKVSKSSGAAKMSANNKADGTTLVARVLESIKQKEQTVRESGWSGGGGRMLAYILEGMTL